LRDAHYTLGIETSCDETAVAVVVDGRQVASSVVSSQVDLHKRYGGVVPEIASRKHVEAILPAVDAALEGAGITLTDVDLIAVTYGPGLVGALLVGVSAAKALSYALDIPLVGVNHIDGHIHANFIAHPGLYPPLLSLTVSGGHTNLIFMPEFGFYELLGETRDDAAGEAFDKIARYLDLGYPGGPAIEKWAKGGDREAFDLPRAMMDEGYDFSFSGVKTAAINLIHNLKQKGKQISIPDFAASFQQAVVDVLVTKVLDAAEELGIDRVAIGGGVAANGQLRAEMQKRAAGRNLDLYFPPLELCTDNAAMIACAGYFSHMRGKVSSLDLNACPRLPLSISAEVRLRPD